MNCNLEMTISFHILTTKGGQHI